MSNNNNEIKRLHYFNGQLLDDNDFLAEQTYHIDMRRRLNQLLYSPGVVKGLDVKKNSDKTIIVSSGFAIDATGCEIIALADSAPLDVSGTNTSIYVTIRYDQPLLDVDKRSKDTISGIIRRTERPIITASSDKAPAGASAGQDIILAKIKLDANGVIESFDTKERQLANVKIGNKVGIGTTDPGVYQMFVDGTTRLGAIKNYGSETILSIAPGTVQFDANAVQGGRLTIKGDTGYVGIGTTEPKSVLSVSGGLSVGATYAKTNAAPANGLLVEGNVGIGTHSPGEKLEIKSGKLQLDGNQQIKFTDTDITNNLKLQLYTGYGLGINAGTLFYAANGNHSWRDNTGTNERMLLTTGTDGGLTVRGTGNSSFAGKLGIGTTEPKSVLSVSGGLSVGATYAKTNAAPANGLLVEGKAGIGTSSPGARLEVAGTLTAIQNDETLIGLKLAPTFQDGGKTGIKRCILDVAGVENTENQISLQVKSGNTATRYDSNQITFGYNNTAQYRHALKTRHNSTQRAGNAIDFYVWNYGTEAGAADKIGGLHTLTLDGGNVGIGTPSPSSKLHIDIGRVDITSSDLTGGGGNRFDGLYPRTTSGRSQLVLSSNYSDLVIASSQANNNHGSTLTFVTYNPDSTKPTEYRKWVINQGNWNKQNDGPNRKQFLDFGYKDADDVKNPHDCISTTNTVLTLDGVNKRVGIGITNPMQKLMVVGPNGGKNAKDPDSGLGGGGQLAIKGDAPQLDFIDTDHPDWAIHVNSGKMYFIREPWEYTDLVLDGKGNVGIGTDDPGNVKLKVSGNAYVTGTLWANTLVHYWAPGNAGWLRLQNGAYGESYSAPSDLRFKTDLRPIRRALDKVLKLHGKYYRWGEDGLKYFTRDITKSLFAGPDATEEENEKLRETERQKAYQALSGDQMGLIAQDLEAVVPEVVSEDKDGYKYVDYQHLIALLVEAIKEQNEQITALASKMAS